MKDISREAYEENIHINCHIQGRKDEELLEHSLSTLTNI
jgi:hypothetical protein